jgi:hypothetical protein
VSQEKKPPADLFPFDELSTGEASALLKYAQKITGVPDKAESSAENDEAQKKAQEELKKELRVRSFAMTKKEGPKSSTKPAPKPTGDTFIQRKIKEAEQNLPDFDFDDPDTET